MVSANPQSKQLDPKRRHMLVLGFRELAASTSMKTPVFVFPPKTDPWTLETLEILPWFLLYSNILISVAFFNSSSRSSGRRAWLIPGYSGSFNWYFSMMPGGTRWFQQIPGYPRNGNEETYPTKLTGRQRKFHSSTQKSLAFANRAKLQYEFCSAATPRRIWSFPLRKKHHLKRCLMLDHLSGQQLWNGCCTGAGKKHQLIWVSWKWWKTWRSSGCLLEKQCGSTIRHIAIAKT